MRSQMRRAVLAAIALVLALAGGAVVAGGAAAAATPPSQATKSSLAAVAFIPEVAAEHGYSTTAYAALPRTSTANVTSGQVGAATSGGQVTPNNTVYGSCGSSWLYLSGGNNEYRTATGFSVVNIAVLFGWWVDVWGPYGFYRQHSWGSGYFSSSWATSPWFPVDDSGYYTAQVNGGSYAVLIDGRVCTSLGPASSTSVY
jgi:hypothetical protein